MKRNPATITLSATGRLGLLAAARAAQPSHGTHNITTRGHFPHRTLRGMIRKRRPFGIFAIGATVFLYHGFIVVPGRSEPFRFPYYDDYATITATGNGWAVLAGDKPGFTNPVFRFQTPAPNPSNFEFPMGRVTFAKGSASVEPCFPFILIGSFL